MLKRESKRSIAIITCLAFLWTTVLWDTPHLYGFPSTEAPTAVLDPLAFKLPASLGKVLEFFPASAQARPLIVHIQDAHAVYDAQKSIQSILDYLQKNYGLKIVLLEGAVGPLETLLFRAFPLRSVRDQTFDGLIRAGEVSGSDAAAVLNERWSEFVGIEDRDLYLKDLEAFRSAIVKKPEAEKELAKLRQANDSLKEKLYSPELLELDRWVSAFEADSKRLLDLLRGLSRYKISEAEYPRLNLLIREFSRELEQEAFEKERGDVPLMKLAGLVKKRLGTGEFRELSHHQQNFHAKGERKAFVEFVFRKAKEKGIALKPYQRLWREEKRRAALYALAGEDFFQELNAFIQRQKESLFRSEEERRVDRESRALKLSFKLASLEVTREELQEISASLPDGSASELSSLLAPAIHFYELALQRDRALYENLIKEISRRKVPFAAVVTGGFHTEGIKALLKEKGHPYLVIAPKIGEVGESPYLDVMFEKNLSYAKYLKKGPTPATSQIALMDSFSPELDGGRHLGAAELDWMAKMFGLGMKDANAESFSRFFTEFSTTIRQEARKNNIAFDSRKMNRKLQALFQELWPSITAGDPAAERMMDQIESLLGSQGARPLDRAALRAGYERFFMEIQKEIRKGESPETAVLNALESVFGYRPPSEVQPAEALPQLIRPRDVLPALSEELGQAADQNRAEAVQILNQIPKTEFARLGQKLAEREQVVSQVTRTGEVEAGIRASAETLRQMEAELGEFVQTAAPQTAFKTLKPETRAAVLQGVIQKVSDQTPRREVRDKKTIPEMFQLLRDLAASVPQKQLDEDPGTVLFDKPLSEGRALVERITDQIGLIQTDPVNAETPIERGDVLMMWNEKKNESTYFFVAGFKLGNLSMPVLLDVGLKSAHLMLQRRLLNQEDPLRFGAFYKISPRAEVRATAPDTQLALGRHKFSAGQNSFKAMKAQMRSLILELFIGKQAQNEALMRLESFFMRLEESYKADKNTARIDLFAIYYNALLDSYDAGALGVARGRQNLQKSILSLLAYNPKAALLARFLNAAEGKRRQSQNRLYTPTLLNQAWLEMFFQYARDKAAAEKESAKPDAKVFNDPFLPLLAELEQFYQDPANLNDKETIMEIILLLRNVKNLNRPKEPAKLREARLQKLKAGMAELGINPFEEEQVVAGQGTPGPDGQAPKSKPGIRGSKPKPGTSPPVPGGKSETKAPVVPPEGYDKVVWDAAGEEGASVDIKGKRFKVKYVDFDFSLDESVPSSLLVFVIEDDGSVSAVDPNEIDRVYAKDGKVLVERKPVVTEKPASKPATPSAAAKAQSSQEAKPGAKQAAANQPGSSDSRVEVRSFQSLTLEEAVRYHSRLRQIPSDAASARKQVGRLSEDEKLELIVQASLGRLPDRAELRRLKEAGIFAGSKIGVRRFSEFPGLGNRLKKWYLPDIEVGYVEIPDSALRYLRSVGAISLTGNGVHNMPGLLFNHSRGGEPNHFSRLGSFVYRLGKDYDYREPLHETAHHFALGLGGEGEEPFVERPEVQVTLLEELDAYRRMNLRPNGTIAQSFTAGQRGNVLSYVPDTLRAVARFETRFPTERDELQYTLLANRAMDAIERLDQILPAMDVTLLLTRARNIEEIIFYGELAERSPDELIEVFRPGFSRQELDQFRREGFKPGNWQGAGKTRAYRRGDGRALAVGLLDREARARRYVDYYLRRNQDKSLREINDADMSQAAVEWARPRILYLRRQGGRAELRLIQRWRSSDDPILRAATRQVLSEGGIARAEVRRSRLKEGDAVTYKGREALGVGTILEIDKKGVPSTVTVKFPNFPENVKLPLQALDDQLISPELSKTKGSVPTDFPGLMKWFEEIDWDGEIPPSQTIIANLKRLIDLAEDKPFEQAKQTPEFGRLVNIMLDVILYNPDDALLEGDPLAAGTRSAVERMLSSLWFNFMTNVLMGPKKRKMTSKQFVSYHRNLLRPVIKELVDQKVSELKGKRGQKVSAQRSRRDLAAGKIQVRAPFRTLRDLLWIQSQFPLKEIGINVLGGTAAEPVLLLNVGSGSEAKIPLTDYGTANLHTHPLGSLEGPSEEDTKSALAEAEIGIVSMVLTFEAPAKVSRLWIFDLGQKIWKDVKNQEEIASVLKSKGILSSARYRAEVRGTAVEEAVEEVAQDLSEELAKVRDIRDSFYGIFPMPWKSKKYGPAWESLMQAQRALSGGKSGVARRTAESLADFRDQVGIPGLQEKAGEILADLAKRDPELSGYVPESKTKPRPFPGYVINENTERQEAFQVLIHVTAELLEKGSRAIRRDDWRVLLVENLDGLKEAMRNRDYSTAGLMSGNILRQIENEKAPYAEYEIFGREKAAELGRIHDAVVRVQEAYGLRAEARETAVQAPARAEVRSESLLDAGTFEVWRNRLEREARWSEGVDFNRLFQGRSLLVFGDTHHGFLGVQRGLVERLQDLKDAGVTHLAIEIPSNWKVEDIDKIAQTTRIVHRFKEFVKKAQNLGMTVVFVDMPKEEIDGTWSPDEASRRRGEHMGKFIANALSEALQQNPESRMVALTGYAHIENYEEVPAQLDQKEIPHGLVAIVGEGQQGLIAGLGFNKFFPMGIVSAVRAHAPPDKRYGYVDASGTPLPIEGVIHFPRPRPQAPLAQPLPRQIEFLAPTSTESQGALTLRDMATGLTEIKEGQITNPLHLSFENQVDPHIYTWEKTNEEKIVNFVLQIKGLTNFQKLYLLTLLMSYANNAGWLGHEDDMEHGEFGGSIVTMGFVPELGIFEFTTVDTAHYPYQPGADYGGAMQHREVSLDTLQKELGFSDLFVADLKDLPVVEISNNPERPLSIPKITALVLTAAKHPERIAVRSRDKGMTLQVFYQDVSRAKNFRGVPYLAELEVSDFTLSPTEQRLADARDLLIRFSRFLAAFQYQPGIGFYVYAKRSSIWPQTRFGRRVMATLGSLSAPFVTRQGVPSSLDRGILNARKNLRFVNEIETKNLLAQLDETITSIQTAINQVEAFYKRYPAEAEQTDPKGRKGKEHLQQALEWQKQLLAIRDELKQPLRGTISGISPPALPMDASEPRAEVRGGDAENGDVVAPGKIRLFSAAHLSFRIGDLQLKSGPYMEAAVVGKELVLSFDPKSFLSSIPLSPEGRLTLSKDQPVQVWMGTGWQRFISPLVGLPMFVELTLVETNGQFNLQVRNLGKNAIFVNFKNVPRALIPPMKETGKIKLRDVLLKEAASQQIPIGEIWRALRFFKDELSSQADSAQAVLLPRANAKQLLERLLENENRLQDADLIDWLMSSDGIQIDLQKENQSRSSGQFKTFKQKVDRWLLENPLSDLRYLSDDELGTNRSLHTDDAVELDLFKRDNARLFRQDPTAEATARKIREWGDAVQQETYRRKFAHLKYPLLNAVLAFALAKMGEKEKAMAIFHGTGYSITARLARIFLREMEDASFAGTFRTTLEGLFKDLEGGLTFNNDSIQAIRALDPESFRASNLRTLLEDVARQVEIGDEIDLRDVSQVRGRIRVTRMEKGMIYFKMNGVDQTQPVSRKELEESFIPQNGKNWRDRISSSRLEARTDFTDDQKRLILAVGRALQLFSTREMSPGREGTTEDLEQEKKVLENARAALAPDSNIANLTQTMAAYTAQQKFLGLVEGGQLDRIDSAVQWLKLKLPADLVEPYLGDRPDSVLNRFLAEKPWEKEKATASATDESATTDVNGKRRQEVRTTEAQVTGRAPLVVFHRGRNLVLDDKQARTIWRQVKRIPELKLQSPEQVPAKKTQFDQFIGIFSSRKIGIPVLDSHEDPDEIPASLKDFMAENHIRDYAVLTLGQSVVEAGNPDSEKLDRLRRALGIGAINLVFDRNGTLVAIAVYSENGEQNLVAQMLISQPQRAPPETARRPQKAQSPWQPVLDWVRRNADIQKGPGGEMLGQDLTLVREGFYKLGRIEEKNWHSVPKDEPVLGALEGLFKKLPRERHQPRDKKNTLFARSRFLIIRKGTSLTALKSALDSLSKVEKPLAGTTIEDNRFKLTASTITVWDQGAAAGTEGGAMADMLMDKSLVTKLDSPSVVYEIRPGQRKNESGVPPKPAKADTSLLEISSDYEIRFTRDFLRNRRMRDIIGRAGEYEDAQKELAKLLENGPDIFKVMAGDRWRNLRRIDIGRGRSSFRLLFRPIGNQLVVVGIFHKDELEPGKSGASYLMNLPKDRVAFEKLIAPEAESAAFLRENLDMVVRPRLEVRSASNDADTSKNLGTGRSEVRSTQMMYLLTQATEEDFGSRKALKNWFKRFTRAVTASGKEPAWLEKELGPLLDGFSPEKTKLLEFLNRLISSYFNEKNTLKTLRILFWAARTDNLARYLDNAKRERERARTETFTPKVINRTTAITMLEYGGEFKQDEMIQEIFDVKKGQTRFVTDKQAPLDELRALFRSFYKLYTQGFPIADGVRVRIGTAYILKLMNELKMLGFTPDANEQEIKNRTRYLKHKLDQIGGEVREAYRKSNERFEKNKVEPAADQSLVPGAGVRFKIRPKPDSLIPKDEAKRKKDLDEQIFAGVQELLKESRGYKKGSSDRRARRAQSWLKKSQELAAKMLTFSHVLAGKAKRPPSSARKRAAFLQDLQIYLERLNTFAQILHWGLGEYVTKQLGKLGVDSLDDSDSFRATGVALALERVLQRVEALTKQARTKAPATRKKPVDSLDDADPLDELRSDGRLSGKAPDEKPDKKPVRVRGPTRPDLDVFGDRDGEEAANDGKVGSDGQVVDSDGQAESKPIIQRKSKLAERNPFDEPEEEILPVIDADPDKEETDGSTTVSGIPQPGSDGVMEAPVPAAGARVMRDLARLFTGRAGSRLLTTGVYSATFGILLFVPYLIFGSFFWGFLSVAALALGGGFLVRVAMTQQRTRSQEAEVAEETTALPSGPRAEVRVDAKDERADRFLIEGWFPGRINQRKFEELLKDNGSGLVIHPERIPEGSFEFQEGLEIKIQGQLIPLEVGSFPPLRQLLDELDDQLYPEHPARMWDEALERFQFKVIIGSLKYVGPLIVFLLGASIVLFFWGPQLVPAVLRGLGQVAFGGMGIVATAFLVSAGYYAKKKWDSRESVRRRRAEQLLINFAATYALRAEVRNEIQEKLEGLISRINALPAKTVKVENFGKTFEQLQKVAERLARDYHRHLTDAGKNPGKVRVYLVGGWAQELLLPEQPLKDHNDIDLVFAVESPEQGWQALPGSRREKDTALGRIIYQAIQDSKIPAGLSFTYTRLLPEAKDLHEYLLRKRAFRTFENEPFGNVVLFDIQGVNEIISEGDPVLKRKENGEALFLLAAYDPSRAEVRAIDPDKAKEFFADFKGEPTQKIGDRTYELGKAAVYPEYREYIIKLLLSLIPQNSSLLSIGPGRGEIESELQKRSNISVTAIELDETFAGIVKEHGFQVLQGNAHETLPSLKEESFDAVLIFETLHWLNREETLREAQRILKAGGLLTIVSPPSKSPADQNDPNWIRLDLLSPKFDESKINIIKVRSEEFPEESTIRKEFDGVFAYIITARKSARTEVRAQEGRLPEGWEVRAPKDNEEIQVMEAYLRQSGSIPLQGPAEKIVALLLTDSERNIKGVYQVEILSEANVENRRGAVVSGHFSVLPDLRGQRYGTLFFNQIKEEYRRRGFETLVGSSIEKEAKGFWIKQGGRELTPEEYRAFGIQPPVSEESRYSSLFFDVRTDTVEAAPRREVRQDEQEIEDSLRKWAAPLVERVRQHNVGTLFTTHVLKFNFLNSEETRRMSEAIGRLHESYLPTEVIVDIEKNLVYLKEEGKKAEEYEIIDFESGKTQIHTLKIKTPEGEKLLLDLFAEKGLLPKEASSQGPLFMETKFEIVRNDKSDAENLLFPSRGQKITFDAATGKIYQWTLEGYEHEVLKELTADLEWAAGKPVKMKFGNVYEDFTIRPGLSPEELPNELRNDRWPSVQERLVAEGHLHPSGSDRFSEADVIVLATESAISLRPRYEVILDEEGPDQWRFSAFTIKQEVIRRLRRDLNLESVVGGKFDASSIFLIQRFVARALSGSVIDDLLDRKTYRYDVQKNKLERRQEVRYAFLDAVISAEAVEAQLAERDTRKGIQRPSRPARPIRNSPTDEYASGGADRASQGNRESQPLPRSESLLQKGPKDRLSLPIPPSSSVKPEKPDKSNERNYTTNEKKSQQADFDTAGRFLLSLRGLEAVSEAEKKEVEREGVAALVRIVEAKAERQFMADFRQRLDKKIAALESRGGKIPVVQVLFQFITEPTIPAFQRKLTEAGVILKLSDREWNDLFNQVLELLKTIHLDVNRVIAAQGDQTAMDRVRGKASQIEGYAADYEGKAKEAGGAMTDAINGVEVPGEESTFIRAILEPESSPAEPAALKLYLRRFVDNSGLDRMGKPNIEFYVFTSHHNPSHEQFQREMEVAVLEYMREGRPVRTKFETSPNQEIKVRGIQSAVNGAMSRPGFGAVVLAPEALPGRMNQVVNNPGSITDDAVLGIVNQVTPVLAVKLARIEALNRRDHVKALLLIEQLQRELSKMGIDIQVSDSGITASWNIGILVAYLETQVVGRQKALVSA